jgi:putative tryptophan/tyrosine transport system substrate-binding protein
MRRRQFIAGIGATAIAPAVPPVTARAQQADRVRRIGLLWNFNENDPIGKSWINAFIQGLAELGWAGGRNLRIDARWNPRTPEQTRTFVEELISLQPDVLVTGTSRLTLAVQQQTRTIPIFFLGAGDPVANGVVANLSRPGGNTTGVTDLFSALGGKWLELLKECMPTLTRAALIFNPDSTNAAAPPSTAISAKEAGSQYGVTVIDMPVRNPGEIERAIPAFAAEPGGGLIVRPPPLPGPDRKLINGLAIRYQLPVIYQDRSFAVEGGLLAYGTDMIAMFRNDGPPYVDRILRGAKPGDLPIQFPTKFILTVNLTTAKAMGLTIPESFLLRADELIE